MGHVVLRLMSEQVLLKHFSRGYDMEVVERLFYEIKPYLCIGFAFFVLKATEVQSATGKVSAITLLVCGTILAYSRLRGRGIIKW